MVYKRYIYRNGKKFGPYYYHTYRDEKGNTHSKYVQEHSEKRAVIHKNNLFSKHSTLFIFLGAIILIFLAISFLSYQFSEKQEGTKAGFFESAGKNVYSFFTGFTTEEPAPETTPDSGTSDSGSSSTGQDNSAPSDATEVSPETPSSETTTIPSEQPITETPTEIIPSTDSNETPTENIPVENITETPQTNESETIPSETESGGAGVSISNQTNQTETNETLGNITITNETLTVNTTSNFTIETSVKQYGAVLWQPVRWEKRVKVFSDSGDVQSLKVDLPNIAGNVSVTKITKNGEEEVNAIVQNEKNIGELSNQDNAETSQGSFLTRAFNFILGIIRFTGNVVNEGQNNDASVEITNAVQDQDEIIIEYYTDAPYSEETNLGNGNKEISVIGPDQAHYENILAFTQLEKEAHKTRIKLYHVANGENNLVNVSFVDSNNNGLVDGIEWVVPSLSRQDYSLEISQARDVRVIVELKNENLKTDLSDYGVKQKNIDFGGNKLEVVSVDENILSSLEDNANIQRVVEDQPVSLLLSDSENIIRSLDVRNEFGLNGTDKKVCVLDTGVDYNNPAITNYFTGWDFVNNDSDVMDDNGHGTSVAGVASKIAPGSQLYIAKVIDANGTGYESTILEGLQWCMDNNVDVVSFSIGSGSYNGFCDSNIVAELANSAVASGIFVVAATGNDGNLSLKSPSCASNVTRVASTNKQDEISNFSSGGEMIDVLAPGENVVVPVLGNGFDLRSGTSLSAPMVAAGAAIVLENESLSPLELKYRLRSTGKPIEYSIDLLTQINISRLDVYNAVMNNKTMIPYDYSGNQAETNNSNRTIELLANGCTFGSCNDGQSCCNAGASTCIIDPAGTTYTCQDCDTTATACGKCCDSFWGGLGGGACLIESGAALWWYTAGATCCGDDSTSADNFNGNSTFGCCCSSSHGQIATGNDAICTGNSNYWCLDGTYCTASSGLAKDPSLTAGGTTYTFNGDDIVCGCDSSGAKCDTNDSDTVANGLCGSSACITGTLTFDGSSTYTQSCTKYLECDSDVTPTSTTPLYSRDGWCRGNSVDSYCCTTVVISGEVAPAAQNFVGGNTELCYPACDTGGLEGCDATPASSGNASLEGFCTATSCDADEICNDEETYNSDCSSCSSTHTDIDTCDSNVSSSNPMNYSADGYCTTGGTCSTGVVYNNSGTLTDSCSNGGGQACDGDATGSEAGSWTDDANGICVSGSTCDTTTHACYNGTLYFDACSTSPCSGYSSGTVYVCDSSITDAAFTTGGICGNSGGASCLTGAACKDSESSDGINATCGCAATAVDWDPYDSSVSNGAFSANGICIGATPDTTGEACYDGENYQSSCASCGQTTANNDACDSIITDGSYSANGMCVSGDTCDVDEVCDNEGTILNDCSSCSSTHTDIDKCDSNGGTSFGGDGYCSTGGTCSTGTVYNNSGTLTNGCSNGDAKICDSDANGTENGAWLTYADGVCVSGSSCDIVDVCLNQTTYYGSISSCSDNDQCDSDVDSTGFVRDGYVCSSSCYVDASRTAGQSCCATANCAGGGLICSSGTCTVPGNPPIITQLAIAPSSPTHIDNLNCNVTATDIDNSTFTIEWYWYKGTTLVVSGNTTGVNNNTNTIISTLLEENTSKGEVWNCTVRGYDNVTYGDYNSTNVTIAPNQIPDTPAPTLLSSDGSNNTQSNLTCIVLITDPDGENMNVSVNWSKNNVFNSTYDFNNNYINGSVFNATLTAGNLSAGDFWNCSVRTYDSWNYSSWGYSNAVTIVYPSVDLRMIYPTGNINTPQNSFFNVSMNVTCRKDNCGAINTSLYSNNSLVNITIGATPFYTNASTNPLTTSSLISGQSEIITFWVNATGSINTTSSFFAYANLTSNLSISNKTSEWNVTIGDPFSLAIDLSPKLTSQINWTLTTIPVSNQSAEGNNGTLATEYWVNISVGGGTADLYLKASGNLTTSGGSILGLGNETYSYNSTNSSVPSDIKYQMTTSFADNKIASAMSSGLVYLKFFLNVPAGQAAGTYNNTVDFKAVQAGQAP